MNKDTCVLTIVIIFHNMRREAIRTLYTLSPAYQRGVEAHQYEVIAIDNGSSFPLDKQVVESISPNFKYYFYETNSQSPAEALNYGISIAKSSYMMLMIDGARMVSPGLVAKTLEAFRAFKNPFIITLSLHLGNKLQNYSILEGYTKEVEDQLLTSVDWKSDGYELFKISDFHTSNYSHFSTRMPESNCFALRRDMLSKYGGFDVRFAESGGGLTNLEIFERYTQLEEITVVSLIGEASFHQLHGGVSTNVVKKEHPIDKYKREYKKIFGYAYQVPEYELHYWGAYPKGHDYLIFENNFFSTLTQIIKAFNEKNTRLAEVLVEELKKEMPQNEVLMGMEARLLFSQEKYTAAKKKYQEIFEGTTDELPGFRLGLGWAHFMLKEYEQAIACFKQANQDNPRLIKAIWAQGKCYQKQEKYATAIECFERFFGFENCPKHMKQKCLQAMITCYEKLGNQEKVLFYRSQLTNKKIPQS